MGMGILRLFLTVFEERRREEVIGELGGWGCADHID